MYKVFVNQDVIILTSVVPFGKKINLYDLKKKSIDDIISLVKKHHKIYLFHKNSEKLISTFKKKIKVVKAGGGIVKNRNDETLFIYRRNKWDLPKGKMDNHIFKKEKNFRLKVTSWYNMLSNYEGKFIPETKEGISKVVWKNNKKIKKIKNTFPNIKLLLEN